MIRAHTNGAYLPHNNFLMRKLFSFLALMLVIFALSAAFAMNPDEAPLTPIKHLVVIFPENISFDHYFGTYPHAENPRTSRGSWQIPTLLL
jgi:phospholipase C